MIGSFSYSGSPAQVSFGYGTIATLGTWLQKLGKTRALVLTTPQLETEARARAERLGPTAVGVFAGAVMHTPVEVTERAVATVVELGADCLVALGGGSTTGLGKAIAYRTDLIQIAIPTTYAGSEATPILGQTEGGRKTTIRDPKILPEVIIYDPELTLGLPIGMTVTSGLNAIAHAAEGLYAQDRNPISSLMATEGLRALNAALPVLTGEPKDRDARAEALYGAWLCGTVLGTVGMSLHHKICHTLGGSFDLPHAETHAVMLPHTIGFNAGAVPELLEPVASIFGGKPGQALFDFAGRLGAPKSLAELGMAAADLDRAADIAMQSPYWNPRPFDRSAIRSMLEDAWQGRRPQD